MDEDKQVLFRVIGVAVVIAIALLVADLYALNQRNTAGTLKGNPGSSTRQSSPQAPTSDKDTNGCFTSDTVRKHEGENGCVDFNVGYTYTSARGSKFIDQYSDYTSGFSVYIPSTSSASNVDLSQFQGKNIKVSGYIQDYQGGPEVIVTDLSQIRIYQ